MLSRLSGSNHSKEIETSVLKVRGRNLIFMDTIYPIANLSVIEVGDIKRSLPGWFWILILFTFGGFVSENPEIGLIGLILAGAYLYYFMSDKKHGLRLVTNSGESALIVSPDRQFVTQVALVLHAIIEADISQAININFDQRQIVDVNQMDGGAVVMRDVRGDLVQSV